MIDLTDDAPAEHDPADRPDTALLRVRGLRTYFPTTAGVVRAVDDVTFEVGTGRALGVVGESGSGKSALCRSVMNLLPRTAVVPDDTEIVFDGREVRRLPKNEAAHFWGVEMSMIFQDPMTSLNPVMRIGRQLAGPLRYHLGLGPRDAARRAVELLELVGVPAARDRARQYPHELSGGMRQRVTIARALACQPRLVIADEPTTALDVTIARQILDLLTDLRRTRQMAMILVTHDLGVVAGRTDEVIVMYAGQVVEQAATTALFREPLHPYSQGLLGSIPRMHHPNHTRLRAIPGRPPVVLGEPGGCPFAPRCDRAQAVCRVEQPRLAAAGEPGRLVRCFFPGTAPQASATISATLTKEV